MPKRSNQQHVARRRRREQRERRQKLGIPPAIIIRHGLGKKQIPTQAGGAAVKPVKNYKLILVRGTKSSDERFLWVANIKRVFGKTETEAYNLLWLAEDAAMDEAHKPVLVSSVSIEVITGWKDMLTWSLREATKIKEA